MVLTPSLAAAAPPASASDSVAIGLGRALVDAIVRGDFDLLEALLAPDMRFRALTPRTAPEASTADGARAVVEGWFATKDGCDLVSSTVDLVGDRLSLVYRIRTAEAGTLLVVEQHVTATVQDGHFRDIALVCSGFRPLAADAEGTVPAVAPSARLDATGLTCATLTPTIRSAVNGLDIGAVLEIVSDDPEAEAGLRSWTRLTGNEFVDAEVGPGSSRRFRIRRTPRQAANTRDGGTN